MDTTRKRVLNNPNGDTLNNGYVPKENQTVKSPGASGQDNTKTSGAAVAAIVLSPAVITTFVLIFGGCCSNVYTLESILTLSPTAGPLFTFLQFLLTSIFTLPTQLTRKTSPSGISSQSSRLLPRLRTRQVPLYKWIVYTIMFLTINTLNNKAFGYRISVPLHIILRSAGPVTSMLVGYLFAGRRYEFLKIVAVMFLFSGVILAALSDASSKGKFIVTESPTGSDFSKQLPGFLLLFSALVLSAFMGIYTDELYRQHGRSTVVTSENLFYSHALSLPYFAAQYKELYGQFATMVANASIQSSQTSKILPWTPSLPSLLQPLASYVPVEYLTSLNLSAVPIMLLLANALTQIVCITGVNQLSTQTTSLTVSIVLNIRKLVSLLLSIWLFENKLSIGVTVGAALVFLGGGLYSIPSRSLRPETRNEDGKKDTDRKKEI